ncbi:hypothetical protein BJ138DRAFT_1168070 [Hygrophoropsis aurantiaca]|uniref:Uncharacterized protein n=1 Tax=Hygrophoropsis aurantiaca TaxID=72124 RepID=A0ACB7ZQZ2_9AGAM|nr:hypothetical protein BJ138DRAFT_1168070 [Hygrophoropsis aurantiaca]
MFPRFTESIYNVFACPNTEDANLLHNAMVILDCQTEFKALSSVSGPEISAQRQSATSIPMRATESRISCVSVCSHLLLYACSACMFFVCVFYMFMGSVCVPVGFCSLRLAPMSGCLNGHAWIQKVSQNSLSNVLTSDPSIPASELVVLVSVRHYLAHHHLFLSID